ncbi:MAG: hypothetical protein F6K56_29165 [Moorea sp. SIO3G5]|nr:hypothetical protein [Moorena sp. SIO3G5]
MGRWAILAGFWINPPNPRRDPPACSLFPTPYSLLPIPCSLFPIPHSLLPVPCSLFPVPFAIAKSTIIL